MLFHLYHETIRKLQQIRLRVGKSCRRRDDGGRRVGGNGDSVRGGKGLRGVELEVRDRE